MPEYSDEIKISRRRGDRVVLDMTVEQVKTLYGALYDCAMNRHAPDDLDLWAMVLRRRLKVFTEE